MWCRIHLQQLQNQPNHLQFACSLAPSIMNLVAQKPVALALHAAIACWEIVMGKQQQGSIEEMPTCQRTRVCVEPVLTSSLPCMHSYKTSPSPLEPGPSMRKVMVWAVGQQHHLHSSASGMYVAPAHCMPSVTRHKAYSGLCMMHARAFLKEFSLSLSMLH